MSKGQAKPWFPSPKREPDPEPGDKAIGTAVEPEPTSVEYELDSGVMFHRFESAFGGKCEALVTGKHLRLAPCGYDVSHAVHHRDERLVSLENGDKMWVSAKSAKPEQSDPWVSIDENGQEVGRIEAFPETAFPTGTTNITMTVETLHCSNVQCRIVTYRGGVILPFRHCPVCNTPGLVTSS